MGVLRSGEGGGESVLPMHSTMPVNMMSSDVCILIVVSLFEVFYIMMTMSEKMLDIGEIWTSAAGQLELPISSGTERKLKAHDTISLLISTSVS